ncbi:peptidase M16-like [Acidisarcina polymorpha]|uniref:Peptidase M16-like n=1 Tax=Acidisarcina polymorpha TaxID=2211140 RepID=A0A2Z5G9B5_9BACT|nr:pitrilysin family protein [Acidisarcina polymorpha]AXC15155.1 peptidase M16-like [Acidisarcina polymorpha]
MNAKSLLLVGLLTASVSAVAQSGANVPSSNQPQPWKSIPIPPLATFHPVQPKRIALKNGVVIFLAEDHELPFITGFIEIKGGSRDEPAAKAGLVSLYGDAWRTSGTTTQDGDKLDDILEAKAAKVETSGDIDSTSVSWNCLKQDEDQVFGIASDLLMHPAFNEEKLTLSKQQMAAGIVRRNDEAAQIASREASILIYGKNSPYAREPEIATVMSVTVADLKAWHDRTVIPNGMIIGVSGDFDSTAMEQKLRGVFDSLPPGAPIQTAKQEFPGPKPGVYFVDKSDVNQSNIRIVGLGTERKNPDFYALSVMNEIFSGGFGSRLFQDVRTKRGLAYSVGGAYGASYDHPGTFYVAASTKSTTTVDATQAMLDEINDLKTVPFTEDELKRAKDEVLNSFIFRYDSVEKVLDEQAKLEFYGYPLDYLDKYRDAVEKVTTADLERVAKKYVDSSKLAILVVGNSSEMGTPLSKLGTVQPLDITIPMPPGMAGPQGPGGDQ